MKVLLSLVLVLCVATVAWGQPPQRGPGKFGMGPGHFGDPAQITQMRHRMRQTLLMDEPEVRRPGPPPWAGRGMMQRGPRGPQSPFLGRGPRGQRHDFRRSGPKAEVSGHHRGHRGQGWQHRGPKFETGRRGFEKQNHRGHTKKCRSESCHCKDCPNNK